MMPDSSERMSPKRFLGEDDVEVAGDVHEVHGHGVDELVLDGDVGVVGLEGVDSGAPELGTFEDVGLVDGGEFFAALAGELEGDAGYTHDFVARVAHGVDGLAGFLVPGAGLAEVEAAEELPDEENVNALGDFGAEGRVFRERGVGDRGAQVGEASEDLTNL